MSPFVIPGLLFSANYLLAGINDELQKKEEQRKESEAGEEIQRREAKDPCSRQNIVARIQTNYDNYTNLIQYRNDSRKERNGSVMPKAYYALAPDKVYSEELTHICRAKPGYNAYGVQVFEKGRGTSNIEIDSAFGMEGWEHLIGKIHHYGPWSQVCLEHKRITPAGTLIPDEDNPCKQKPFIGDYPGTGKPKDLEKRRKEAEQLDQRDRDAAIARANARAEADRRAAQQRAARLTIPDLPSMGSLRDKEDSLEEMLRRLSDGL